MDDAVEGRQLSRCGVQARPEVLCDHPGGAQAAGAAPVPNSGKQARAPDLLGKHQPVCPQKAHPEHGQRKPPPAEVAAQELWKGRGGGAEVAAQQLWMAATQRCQWYQKWVTIMSKVL